MRMKMFGRDNCRRLMLPSIAAVYCCGKYMKTNYGHGPLKVLCA